MKVFLHIGPHKTGTTALQRALYRHASSGRCGYFYPSTTLVSDLAHAQLAWRFLGLAGCDQDRGILQRRVEAAQVAGFDKVVFSSEEFSRALFVDGGFRAFAPFCERVDCELVITLSPLAGRVLAELQEAVKHGSAFDLEHLGDLQRLYETRPGLRNDFLEAAVDGVKASRVSVILVDKRQPEKMYRDMSKVIGEEIPVPEMRLVNESAPVMKTIWHNAFNQRFPDLPWEIGRAVADAAYAAAAREYAPIRELGPIKLPPSSEATADRLWTEQLQWIRRAERDGRLRCL